MSLAAEPRTLRSFFRAQLAALVQNIAGAQFAALASEDGMLLATAQSAEAQDTDRTSALVCSLSALARTTAAECTLGELTGIRIEGQQQHLFIEPFDTQQDSGPKRRLLYIILAGHADTTGLRSATAAFIAATRQRLNPS
ncbi:MAG TPA: roadblock/LC7 domain-containing protein [Burkholderiaceae bacterium]|nr:roadblock/LC7 domain-containing protein [Burkholderiaceae bacterium]